MFCLQIFMTVFLRLIKNLKKNIRVRLSKGIK